MLQEWIHKNLQPCGTKYFKKLLTSKVVYDIINSGQVLFIFEYHKNTRNPCVCTHTRATAKMRQHLNGFYERL